MFELRPLELLLPPPPKSPKISSKISEKSAPLKPPNEPIRPGENYGSINIRRYWDLNESFKSGIHNPVKNESEAIATTEKTLRKAVKNQMISDVPLGAFLSGGVDSSLIVALMQRNSSERIKTYSIGFPVKEYDETSHARAVAKHLDTDHHEFQVTPSATDILPKLVWSAPLPSPGTP